ncbi:hypothetical protein DNTS_034083 [Danionella cerebrum]|uniref:Uncharacterized protein n=1 Tax=Danionella cerebrum TaxID=2873325 RepID=A0A553RF99_9TELE|nr:hypothetical protein DNTS_034083 [Danionella translucida]
MAGRGSNGRGTRGQGGAAAALARLLHSDSVQLLDSYRKSESLPSSGVSGVHLVSVPPLVPQLSDTDKISILRAALKECLQLLEDVIAKEDEEFSDESDYKTKQKTVRDRLRHLLASTEQLADGQTFAAEVKENVLDGQSVGSSFGLKMWTVRVLQEIVHWTGQTSDILQSPPAVKHVTPRTRTTPRTRKAIQKSRK